MSKDDTMVDPAFPDHMTQANIHDRCWLLINTAIHRHAELTDDPVIELMWRWLHLHLSAVLNEGPSYRLSKKLIALAGPRVPKK